MAQTATDDGSNPSRHKHIYEREDGTERAVIINKAHVPVEEAAEQLGIENTDNWTWVYSEALVLNGAAVPCADCGAPVWMTKKTAKINRGEGTARDGPCVRDDDEGQ